jgi:hypothetical protein
MNANPYLRSQAQCVFYDVDCECLVGTPCQVLPPETAASLLERAERVANDLIVVLHQLQSITPSGSELAKVAGVVKVAQMLESSLHEMKRDRPA